MTATPEQRVAALACWSGPVSPAPLAGGMTNKNYVVEDGGARFVVRLGEDIPVHGILRFNELAASRAAAAAGISPEVVYAQPGALVMRYIDGHALTSARVREAALLPRIVELVRRCHRELPKFLRGPALMFWVFQVIRGYAVELAAQGSRHAASLPSLLDKATRLEREVGEIEVVFGHNDLLAANFIDDGTRLWLIDWDYAGFNSPLFDLGGLVSNNELDKQRADYVLERYYGAVDAGLKRRFLAMKCASLLREAMWSMVSEIHSNIAFDYVSYTDENLRRFERAYLELEG